MEELLIYDRDKGIFKKILEQSTLFAGRYHVSDNQGQDLNSNNLGTLVPKLSDGQKYPLVVCAAPTSVIEQAANGGEHEVFNFRLFFLCTTYYGSNHATNPNTRTSAHEIWYDWQDMKNAARDFIKTLGNVVRRTKFTTGYLVANTESVPIRRVSKFGEDRYSGVVAFLQMTMIPNNCTVEDYPAQLTLEIDETVHAKHQM